MGEEGEEREKLAPERKKHMGNFLWKVLWRLCSPTRCPGTPPWSHCRQVAMRRPRVCLLSQVLPRQGPPAPAPLADLGWCLLRRCGCLECGNGNQPCQLLTTYSAASRPRQLPEFPRDGCSLHTGTFPKRRFRQYSLWGREITGFLTHQTRGLRSE